jgi:tetratricopeptide (TPR) repeat protein
MTMGNPLAALTEPPMGAARKRGRVPVGTIGDWKIYEIKKGGMGDVYICGQEGLDGEFALKSFQSRLFFDPPSRAAFLREITAWLRLTGTPFVMPAFGVAEDRGRLLVRMLAVGQDNRGVGTIRDLIARKCASPTEAFRIALQFASGMQFTGQTIPGVSHGDLTPENLLYNGGPVLISDFGLVAIGRGEKGLRATPPYEAPEYSSTGPSPAGDVYSFGIIIDELIKSCTSGGFLSALRRSTSNELLQALDMISQSCRAPDPRQRPPFDGIVCQLFEMLKSHPDELRDVFLNTAMLHGEFRNLQTKLAPDIARSLLKVGAPETALQVIDTIPEAQRGGMVGVLKGSSLSLLDRDEEALPCFEQALRAQLSDAERLSCRSEYALSLKRLGRLQEAKRIYLDLLAEAPENQLAQVVVNLAGVYHEGKEYQEAIDLLSRFIRQHQDEPLAFAALGMACEKLHQHDAAAAHYQRALSLAPQRADIQVALARVCLEHLGRWEEADQALHAAYQQGFMSREWLKLAIVTATLTGRGGDFEGLMTAAERDLPVDDFKRLEKDALELAVAIARKAVGRDESGTAQATEETASAPAAETAELTEYQSPPVEQSGAGCTDGAPTAFADSPFEPAGLPFFTVRFYMPENTFSCDFYDDLDSPAYVEHFLESWNRFRRDPAVSLHAEPRPTPLYFHVCPNCRVSILTNRDTGAGLQCRQCGFKSPCKSSANAKTDELLDRVNKAVGKDIKSYKGLTQYVVFQSVAASPERLDEMKRLCRDAGFLEVASGATTPVGYLAIAQGRKAGLAFDEDREIVVVSKLSVSDEKSHSGDTPPESDRLIRSLRSVAPVRSFSTQINPSAQDSVSLFFAGRKDEFEQRCRNDVASSPEDIGKLSLLVQVLISNKKIQEAKSFALRATVLAPADATAWSSLATVERDLANYDAAIEHAKKALRIDPLERGALVTLFLTYRRLGDDEAAAATWARISALGGPELAQ